ncbi:DUF3341 domain-containing protein [Reyranella sp.]|jgi:hypothetical protein|uniref:DUF3341 domain-containing protein n=1 Tax=Reyranella sp. TaxID=1929291 RepID=UPI002F92F152
MAEPAPGAGLFGMLAEFDRPERLIEAVEKARQAGFRRLDAHTPFPIEGLAERLGFADQRVPLFTLLGGIVGAAVGYGMQVYTNHAFPIDIGNRPLVAPPAFMLITFELTVLFAVLFAIGSMLALNRLPRLHHPLFDLDEFHLASSNKFFLLVLGNDPLFEEERTRAFLETLTPTRISPVEHTEVPE